MATLIKNRRIAPDPWQLLKPAADGGAPAVPPSAGDWLVPLATWREHHARLRERAVSGTHGGRNGVLLENTDDPRSLVADFDKLALIAVRFPKFTDGRGYSIARLLRRLGWEGELRAVGDIQRDQLFYMMRCGFDAYELRDGIDLDNALAAFNDFTTPYQPAVEGLGARFGASPVTAAPAAPAPPASTVNPW
jgi:uncharacterized protein (DUF934 family)